MAAEYKIKETPSPLTEAQSGQGDRREQRRQACTCPFSWMQIGTLMVWRTPLQSYTRSMATCKVLKVRIGNL